MISSVYALGVSPGRTTIDFESGLQKTIDFDVINSGGNDVNVILAVQGDLSDYISLLSGSVSIPAGSHKILSYNINLPERLKPGLQVGEVFIMEVPEKSEDSGSAVLATLAVTTQLYINVPYPGKFAESSLVIYDANQGQDVKFIFPVFSRGEFDLTDVKADVDIYNTMGDKIDNFKTQSISVLSGERKELVYDWNADVPIGNYRASASLIYDEGTISLESTFSVGSKDLELQEISVKSFSLGEIAKLEMLVENKWSEPIVDAHIETRIKNEDGDIVSSFDSANYDIDPLSKQVFVSYWDTAGVKAGNYNTEVSINYGDKSSKKNLEFQVSKNDLRIIGLGYVISAEEGAGMGWLVLILVVIIIILINVLWFFFLRKKIKK